MHTYLRTNSHRHDELSKGFSLLELLIALGITAVVSTTATVHIRGIQRRSVLRAEATSIQMLLEESYFAALAYQHEVLVHLDRQRVYTLLYPGMMRASHTLRDTVSLVLAPGQNPTLQFYPSISATPATLTLQSHGLVCQIVISLRGRIRTTC
jgi:prepilin-type N-terminal cleavage/methylation domain-containing protein